MKFRSILFKASFCLAAIFFVVVLAYAIPSWLAVYKGAPDLHTQISSVLVIKTAAIPSVLALLFSIWAALQWEEQLIMKLIRFFLILGVLISGITYIGIKSIM